MLPAFSQIGEDRSCWHERFFVAAWFCIGLSGAVILFGFPCGKGRNYPWVVTTVNPSKPTSADVFVPAWHASDSVLGMRRKLNFNLLSWEFQRKSWTKQMQAQASKLPKLPKLHAVLCFPSCQIFKDAKGNLTKDIFHHNWKLQSFDFSTLVDSTIQSTTCSTVPLEEGANHKNSGSSMRGIKWATWGIEVAKATI